MIRKLQHTVQALATATAVFGLLLLAGGRPEPDRFQSGRPGAAALVAVAEAEAEATLEASGAEVDGAVAQRDRAEPRSVRRRHRAALAMPYFSFGNGGLRRVTGG